MNDVVCTPARTIATPRASSGNLFSSGQLGEHTSKIYKYQIGNLHVPDNRAV